MTAKELKAKASEEWWNSANTSGALSIKENYIQGYIDGYKDCETEKDKQIEELNKMLKTLTRKFNQQSKLIEAYDSTLEKETKQIKELNRMLEASRSIIRKILDRFPDYEVKNFEDMSLLNALHEAELFLKE